MSQIMLHDAILFLYIIIIILVLVLVMLKWQDRKQCMYWDIILTMSYRIYQLKIKYGLLLLIFGIL